MKFPAYKIIDKLYIEELYSVFLVKYQSGFKFLGECHNFWECMYVSKGSIKVSADERVYNLQNGNIIFHKPMELHKINVDNKNGANAFIFSFKFDGDEANNFKNKVFSLNDEQKNIINQFTDYVCRNMTEYGFEVYPDYGKTFDYDHMYKIYQMPLQQSMTYRHMSQTYIYQLLLSLSKDNTITDSIITRDSIIFKKAVTYMNDSVSHQIYVTDIAKKLNISVSQLKRIFLKHSGLSVHKYFLKLKFKFASKLLKTGLSVTEVSEKLGFSSQSYFSSSFKREMGFYPSSIKEYQSDEIKFYLK
ncbi:MAG: AraC family transcriptional regulator [Clostridia bacterium]|nr:AraC family transcriptional regulator [Clostridia bacterium]